MTDIDPRLCWCKSPIGRILVDRARDVANNRYRTEPPIELPVTDQDKRLKPT
jgi:hypothetical protein